MHNEKSTAYIKLVTAHNKKSTAYNDLSSVHGGDWAWRHGERTLRVTLCAKMVFFVPNFD